MKSILYIHHTFREQSYNSLLYEFAQRANKKKYKIYASCLRESGPYEKKLRTIGVDVKNFQMKTVFDISVIFRIIRHIKQTQVDIVHTAVFPADVYGRISAKLARVPVILSTMHRFEDYKQEINYRIFFWLDRLTMHFATKLIAVSETVRNYLIDWHRLNPKKIVTLYNGVDIDKFKNNINAEELKKEFKLHQDFLTIGIIGRLVPVKGLEYFLDAAASVLANHKKVQFLIVGDGHLKSKLRKKAQDLGISEHIFFTGFRADVPRVLSVLDLFITSSLSEGLPTSVLEAMSVGLPVIGTNVGAIPETVVDGETGVLVQPRDSEALSKAILELMISRDKRRLMGKRGRQRIINHFSIEKMVERYEKLYDF